MQTELEGLGSSRIRDCRAPLKPFRTPVRLLTLSAVAGRLDCGLACLTTMRRRHHLTCTTLIGWGPATVHCVETLTRCQWQSNDTLAVHPSSALTVETGSHPIRQTTPDDSTVLHHAGRRCRSIAGATPLFQRPSRTSRWTTEHYRQSDDIPATSTALPTTTKSLARPSKRSVSHDPHLQTGRCQQSFRRWLLTTCSADGGIPNCRRDPLDRRPKHHRLPRCENSAPRGYSEHCHDRRQRIREDSTSEASKSETELACRARTG